MAASTKGSLCFAVNCATYRNKHSGAEGISFHKFPSKEKKLELHRQWVRNSRRNDEPSKYALLCSKHFEDACFDRTGQNVRLRDSAVPTIFTLPPHLQPVPAKMRSTTTSQNAVMDLIEEACVPDAIPAEPEPAALTTTDHGYAASPTTLKRKLFEAEEQLEIMRKKLKNTKQREKRAKDICQHYIEELYAMNLINTDLRTKLDSYGDIPCELFRKPSTQYTNDQKDFALTLHLFSPKAYEYLRDTVKLPLPNPRTLRRWMESVDCGPGLNMTMLDVLKQRKDKFPSEYTRCCLMIDAMSIRKHVDYNQHTGTCIGYVDLGNGRDTDTLAKEALVFMIVGISGRWKAPIAYYFTAGLSAEAQKELVSHCIDKLHEYKFVVSALTMDGHPSNLSMCTLLGAAVDVSLETRPYITTAETHRTYVTFDACHMLKLTRNMLHAYNTIKSPDGLISWNYIRDLHNSQQEEGLRLGNRLTSKHVLFHQQKMKVSLAVQVLSSSVAKALRTMREVGDARFLDCEPTAIFIERIDRLFDTLNSRTPVGKGYKSRIDARSLPTKRALLVETRAYLLSLKMVDGQPLSSTRRSMCVRGFVILIDSVLALSVDVLTTQKYLLTYKLSQDHLELFFNAIRRCGGWNNNPTARTFTSSFKKIITHCGALGVSQAGNCTPQDQTMLLQSSSTYIPPDASEPDEELDPFLPDQVIFQDHSYDEKKLSPLVENASVYIAGWVVRKLFKTLSCQRCREMLVSSVMSTTFKESFHLLRLKQNGGLVIPSDGCIKVVMTTEKHLRRMSDIHRVSRTLSLVRLQKSVLGDIGACNVFDAEQHAIATQDGIDNHYLSLVRSLVNIFFHLRQHHIVKLQNLRTAGSNVRHTLTKTILFKGQ